MLLRGGGNGWAAARLGLLLLGGAAHPCSALWRGRDAGGMMQRDERLSGLCRVVPFIAGGIVRGFGCGGTAENSVFLQQLSLLGRIKALQAHMRQLVVKS